MQEFINENYLWFIIGGVILLMALIGFVAEKTNFGRGNGNKKAKKNKEVVKESVPTEPVVEQNIPDADNLELEQNNNPTNTEENNIDVANTVEEDLAAPIEPITEDNTLNNIDEDLTAPLEPIVPEEKKEEELLDNINEDLTVPLNFDNTINNEPTATDKVDNVSDNNEKAVEEIIPEEPMIEEVKENDDILKPNDQDIKLPDIDSLEDDEPEEDVWKF